MLKLKKILEDLVEYAYADDRRLPYYKRFYVEYLKKQLKTKNGDYNPETHRLRVFTLNRDDTAIMKTSLHELSHHILFVQCKKTTHGAEFYAIYKKLLFAALDMKIFDADKYRACIKDSTDANKVLKMLDEYVPQDTEYKKGIKRVRVSRAYDIKEALKERGYTFNAYDKVWEKELEITAVKEEELFLQGRGAEYYVEDAVRLTF